MNTASQAVLTTIPNLNSSVVSAIINQQSSGFQTFGALADDIRGNYAIPGTLRRLPRCWQ